MQTTRNHKVHSHFGANDYYKFYIKQGGTVDRNIFGNIMKDINLAIAKKILEGYSFKLPSRMGILAVTRKKEFVGLKDGKAITNRPIDFHATNKLWQENPEAKAQKKLVRHLNKHTNGWIYKVAYNKYYANFKNKAVYSAQINRDMKRELAQKIFSGFELEQLVSI